jgi:hypothetical protein
MDSTWHIAWVVVEWKGSSLHLLSSRQTDTMSQRLPWDWDMDTQVSGTTLRYLGDTHNHTFQKYTSKDGKTKRQYLLDVNPWIWERERGDGMNIIDARWIDIRNGLFIDITGLSETQPDTSPGVWSCKNNHRYRTTDLYPMRTSVFEGVLATVPYAYDKILEEEYEEKALVLTEYEGYVCGFYTIDGRDCC